MKLILSMMVLGLLTQTAFAQSIFSTKSTHRDYRECQLNHKKILDRYNSQIETQLTRILQGISIEQGSGTNPRIIALYKQEATRIILKSTLVSILKEQLWNSSLYELYGRDPKNMFRQRLVFQTENLKFDMERKIKEVLDRKNSAAYYVLEEIEHELLKETLTTFGKNMFKTIGNGLVAKLATGTAFKTLTVSAVESGLLSFGVHVLKGAGIGVVIGLVTEPLKGSRPTPSKIWTDILEEYPEFVINPQWMTDAKSPDHPWMTHCDTIQRLPELMTKVVKRFLSKEENQFMTGIRMINNQKLALLEEEMLKKYPALRDKPQPADNTYVHRESNLIDQTPYWARK